MALVFTIPALLVWSWLPHTKGVLVKQAVQQYDSVSIYLEFYGDGPTRTITIPASSYLKHSVWGWNIGILGSCTVKVYDRNNNVIYEDHPMFYRGYKMNPA
jgi:hypothetical protein